MVPQVQHYTDEQIAQWDADDRLDDDERRHILEAVIGRTRAWFSTPSHATVSMAASQSAR